jgi:hypothetical protein
VTSVGDRDLAMSFLTVARPATTGWKADPAALTAVMRPEWSHVETDCSDRSEVRSVVWTFRTAQGPAEAYLHRDGTCLYIDASFADAARLAVLFRGLAPEGAEVIFCDEAYTFDVHVTSQMTAEDLVSAVA